MSYYGIMCALIWVWRTDDFSMPLRVRTPTLSQGHLRGHCFRYFWDFSFLFYFNMYGPFNAGLSVCISLPRSEPLLQLNFNYSKDLQFLSTMCNGLRSQTPSGAALPMDPMGHQFHKVCGRSMPLPWALATPVLRKKWTPTLNCHPEA